MQVASRVIMCYIVSTNWMSFFFPRIYSDVWCNGLLERCEKKEEGEEKVSAKTIANMADRMEKREK